MRRVEIEPRRDWRAKVEALGFDWHTTPDETDPVGTYWDEGAYWLLDAAEVDVLEEASDELHRLCLAAAERIVAERRPPLADMPPQVAEAVVASWRRCAREPSLFGRFDLAWAGAGNGPPKLLEYNADTPTGLFEAAVVQWGWLEDAFPGGDQFNSVHEALVDGWRAAASLLAPADGGGPPRLHFTCAAGSAEDEGTLRYLQDTALEAGLVVKPIAPEDIGWSSPAAGAGAEADGWFVDLDEARIETLVKLLPWEWMATDPFGAALAGAARDRRLVVIEPAWKLLLSDKALLAVLWEMFPGHPNLAEAHLDRAAFAPGSTVFAKPRLGREGANVSIAVLGEGGRVRGEPIESVPGPYGAEGWVYQRAVPVAEGPGRDRAGDRCTQRAVIGSWIIGGRSRGIGLREDSGRITRDRSRFVPHSFA